MPRQQSDPGDGRSVTFSSGHSDGSPPDLRILHYNDVYHLDPASAEPKGGVARFITVCDEYRSGAQFEGQPKLVTLFSGDAFNPSLESSVTKGTSSPVYFPCRICLYSDQILGLTFQQVTIWFLF
jgi:hypothetical protein